MSIYIIAEAGVNHNGDRETALKMIDAAKKCGCDCVKFQTFSTEDLVTKTAEKAKYQVENTGDVGSQYQMLKSLELSREDFFLLKRHCEEVEIDFMATPFDCRSVDILDALDVSAYKISSGDITNKLLLEYVADKKKPVILSTGMCTMEEIREAVGWMEKRKNSQITLLHCTSNYPAPYDEVNMNAMQTLKEQFSCDVGYSDHTKGIVIPVMAAAMGAAVIEKHFTLDKEMDGPDHKASLDVEEMASMVEAIRIVEMAKGDGVKRPRASEMNAREVARKSVVLKNPLPKGAVLKSEDLEIKRPGTGIAPKYLEKLVGKALACDKEREAVLQWTDIVQEMV